MTEPFSLILKEALLNYIVLREEDETLNFLIMNCVQDYFKEPKPFEWRIEGGDIRVSLDMGFGLWDSRSTWDFTVIK